ncbi:MAG: hypothetical protein MUP66_04095 [Candidatus Nanohaloarchaeota archaeon QJJ-5]|nr:hypothetical protein [Candidatus Nanohaloarchaeota archaeon QJJ-5]
MPSFKCPQCGDEFDERRDREQHVEAVHESPDPRIERFKELMTSKKFWGASIAIFLMIILPLGSGIFYSSIGGGSSSQIDLGFLGGGYDWQTNPPVGHNVQQVPQVNQDQVPTTTILDSPIPKKMQVYLLLRGSGSQQNPGPAAILQYSCQDCPETVSRLQTVAQQFNSEANWVYVAPNPDMDDRVTLSVYQSLQTFDDPSEQELATSICDSFSTNFQRFSPLQCEELSG